LLISSLSLSLSHYLSLHHFTPQPSSSPLGRSNHGRRGGLTPNAGPIHGSASLTTGGSASPWRRLPQSGWHNTHPQRSASMEAARWLPQGGQRSPLKAGPPNLVRRRARRGAPPCKERGAPSSSLPPPSPPWQPDPPLWRPEPPLPGAAEPLPSPMKRRRPD